MDDVLLQRRWSGVTAHLRSFQEPEVRVVTQQRDIGLLALLLVLTSWADTSLPFGLVKGLPAVGYAPPYGIFPQQPAKRLSMDDVLQGWQSHNARLIAQLKPGKHDEFLLTQSIEDATNGFCTFPLTSTQLQAQIQGQAHRLIPRCVITQSSGKQRVIDNGDTGGQSELSSDANKLTLCSPLRPAQHIALVMHEWSPEEQQNFHQVDHWETGQEDLPSAYRFCPMSRGESLGCVVVWWHQEWQAPAFQLYTGLLFGLPLAVTSFNRLSRVLESLSRRLGYVIEAVTRVKPSRQFPVTAFTGMRFLAASDAAQEGTVASGGFHLIFFELDGSQRRHSFVANNCTQMCSLWDDSETYIAQLELSMVLFALVEKPALFRDRRGLWFLERRSCHDPSAGQGYWEYVQSKSNWADDISRLGIHDPWNGLEYNQQQKFMLAWPKGVNVMLWGGYGWSRMSDGPPGCNDKGGSPHCQPEPVYAQCMATPYESPLPKKLSMERRWICEHRWEGVAGLIEFRKACGGLPVTRTWQAPEVSPGQLAFRIGEDSPQPLWMECFGALVRGYNEKQKSPWGHLGNWRLSGLEINLPSGRYCDMGSVILSGFVKEGDLLAIYAGGAKMAMDFDVDWNGEAERVTVVDSAQAAERIIGACCATSEPCFVGFDTEWGSQGQVALVQLATESMCLLCLLPEVSLHDCPSLMAMLSNPHHIKVGVAVVLDADLLKEQFKIEVRGCLDLSRLAAREGEVSSSQPLGLAALTQLLLGFELSKDPAIRRSNWGQRPLSQQQLEYAARDALAGRDCARILARKCRPAELQLLHWCQDLLDKNSGTIKPGKMKKATAEESNGPESLRVSKATLECGAYSCVTKFGLRPVFGSDGEQLLHMKDRTVEGLLRRGMASICQEGDLEIVQLNFTPTDHYAYAGLDAAERNACVGCASYGVARYYIIPRVFFAHLPQQCKSYNCHDVVMLCPKCRAIAEPAQLSLTQELLAAHGALRAGSMYANENFLNPQQIAAKKAAITLKKGDKGKGFPAAKLNALQAAVAAGLGMSASDLGDGHLSMAENLGSGSLPSERVVQAAASSPESLRDFLRSWRECFVNASKPQYLAQGWSLDTGLDGRFIPSVASSLEWPGDWRCSSCGAQTTTLLAESLQVGAEEQAQGLCGVQLAH
eukprot:s781_g14.t1